MFIINKQQFVDVQERKETLQCFWTNFMNEIKNKNETIKNMFKSSLTINNNEDLRFLKTEPRVCFKSEKKKTFGTSYVTTLTPKRKWTRGVEGRHHIACLEATSLFQVISPLFT